MSGVTNKGDVSARDGVGSGIIENGHVTRVIYRGTLESVKAAMPSKGSQVVENGERRLVWRTVVTPLKGGLAEGVVELKAARATLSVQNQSAVWEIEMAQIEKPLLTREEFSGYAGVLLAWRDGDPSLKGEYKYMDSSGAVHALAGAALDAARLMAKGVESYLVFAPVATKNMSIGQLPSDFGKNCGKKETPDLAPSSGDWEWLKTADRCAMTDDGTWVRTEQWTAADKWDDDLYETAQ